MNATHVSVSLFAGAVLGAGLSLAIVLPGRFSPDPESEWFQPISARERADRSLALGRDPFAEPSLVDPDIVDDIRRGTAFVDHHEKLPGRSIIQPAFEGLEAQLAVTAKRLRDLEERESARLNSETQFYDYTERILKFQTEKLADYWVKFASSDPHEFIHRWVYNELSDALFRSRDLEFWKRCGAIQ